MDVSSYPKPLFKLLLLALIHFTLMSCRNPLGDGSNLGGKSPILTWNNQAFDFGNLNIGSSSSAVFKLTNNGNISAISCSNITLSDNVNFSIASNSCTKDVMAVGGECEIEISSHPMSIGKKDLTISRVCADDVIVQTPESQITAMGITALLNWSPMVKNFGSVLIGQNSLNQTFTLINSGNAPASSCSAPTISDTTNFSIVTDNCTTNNINASGSCNVIVRAHPTSLGLKQAMVSRSCTAGGISSTTMDQITVTGSGSPNLAWSPLTYNFGDVLTGNNSADQTFTLTNSGNVAASGCGTPLLTDIVNFSIVSNTCGSNDVGASANCEAVVRAHPLTLGLKSVSLYRSCAVGGMAQTTTNQIRVNGTGLPVLDWTPLANDFGTVNSGTTTAAQVFTLTNSGPAAATGCSAPTISDNTNFSISVDGCATANLNASANCNISLVANPTSIGQKKTTLSRTCTVGGTVSTTANTIEVISQYPVLAFSPTDFNFGDVRAGDSSSSQAFTLTNSGSLEASGCSVATLSNATDFTITADTCSTAPLSVSNSCLISISANPSAIGQVSTTINRTCTVGGTVSTNNIYVNGSSAILGWSPSGYDFGDVGVGTVSANTNQIYTLSNSGAFPATGCAAPILSDSINFTLINDTCAVADLSAGSSCSVEVQAQPQSKGQHLATLSRTCSVGGVVEINMDGLIVNGIDAPILAWSPKSYNYGDVDNGRESNKKVFTLTNSGPVDATVCDAPNFSDIVNFTVIVDSCGTNDLISGASCTVEVSALPQALGDFSLNISRHCANNGNASDASTDTNQIIYKSVEPSELVWNLKNSDYGAMEIETVSSTVNFILENKSSDDATNCTAPVLSDSVNFAIISDNCGTNDLVSKATCDINVVAQPQSPGVYATQISRSCSNLGTARTDGDGIKVKGLEPVSSLVWDVKNYNFGDVEVGAFTTQAVKFNLENQSQGTDATGCSAPVLLNALDFSIVSDNCGTNDLLVGGNCLVEIIAQPQFLGVARTTLKRVCTVGGNARTTYNEIVVNGVASTAFISWSPLSHDFGSLVAGNTSPSQIFTLTNNDSKNDTMDCSAPTLSNVTDFTIVSDACGVNNLANSNSTCNVEITTNPQSSGTKITTLSRVCVVGGMARTTLNQIKVIATSPVIGTIAWSPLVYDFGDIPVALSGNKKFTLANPALAPAVTNCSAPVLSNTTDFEFDGKNSTCSTQDLNGGESCDVIVVAVPKSTGSKTTTLSRTCVVGGTVSTTTEQIIVNGLPSTPNLAWGSNSYNFGTVLVGSNPTYTITLYNSGGADATGCSSPSLTNSTDFSILSQTCNSDDLVAGGFCNVNVQANPPSVGIKTTTLSRTCTVGGTVSTTTDEIVVTGSLGADWKQAYNESDFKVVKVGTNSNVMSYYFRNPSAINLTGCSVATLDNVTDFSVISNNCSAGTHTAASLCEVQLQSNPVTTGIKSAILSRTCNETGALTIAVSATGGNSALTISQISLGDYTACALLSDGATKCWGSNSYAQLANGAYTGISLTPVYTNLSSTITQIAVGPIMTCARIGDGTVKCWGSIPGSSNGASLQSSANQVTGVSNAVQVSTGNDYACAVINDGTVKCWGRNAFGQLGDGSGNFSSSAVTVAGITTATQISAGYYNGCALLANNTIKCWGYGLNGQLGNGATSNSLTPVSVSGITNAIQIKVASSHSCALLSDNTVKCWGYNGDGQLGDGSATSQSTPVAVSGLSAVSQISLGAATSCALLSNSTIKCWGNNNYGQIDGGVSSTSQTTPVLISGITTATQIANSQTASCALLSNDTVKCWGNNYFGILGDGSRSFTTAAKSISSITNSTQVSSGQNHACARISDGTVKCWGLNNYGQLGDGTLINNATPVTVAGIATATQVVSGTNASCALLSNGTVKCWGYNTYGQLGNGTSTSSVTPVSVSGITTATYVSMGAIHACARLSDSTVKCWGHGGSGSLGNGSVNSSSAPVTVLGINNATQISTGVSSSCARLSDSTVKCWGYNDMGQLGDSTVTSSSIPVVVSGLSGATKVSSGAYHVCAILSDATAKCWGQNSEGRLGDGSLNNSSQPVVVSSLSGVIDISATQYSTCALLSDNNVKCWGGNDQGNLGDGTNITRTSPVYSLSMNSITSLGQGASAVYQCHQKSDGTVLCVGDNRYSQTGINEFSKRTVNGL